MLSRAAFVVTIILFLVTGCSPSKTALTHDSLATITASVATPSVKVLDGTPVPFSKDSVSLENAEQVKQLSRWGKGTLNGLTVSPDGTILAAASTIGVYLYDTATLEEIRFIDTDDWVPSPVFSPDNKLIAIINHGDYKFQLWNISDGKLLYTFEKHTNVVTSVDFSPDGQLLASGSSDHTINIWQVSDGAYSQSLVVPDGVSSVKFSPDGKILATASYDNTVRVWNVSNGILLHTLEVDGYVYSNDLKFSPDGQLLITHTHNGETRLWNAISGTLLANLEKWYPVFSADGQQILTISCTQNMDCSILLWDKNGQLTKNISNHQPLYSAVFSPDGQYIAAGTMDDIFLFRVSDGALIKAFEFDILINFSEPVNFLSFSTDGQTLISKSGVRDLEHIQQWRIEDGFLLKDERFSSMEPVTFSEDGNLMAVATGDLIEIWNTSNGTIIGTLKGHTNNITCLMFSADNQTLIAGEKSNIAHLWRLSDGALLQTIEIAATDWIVNISPDMQMMASTNLSGNISLWNVSDGKLIHTLTGHTQFAMDIKFSIDRQTLVSVSYDDDVKIWNLSNGTLINTVNVVTQGGGSDYQIDISPDGKMVAIVGRGYVPLQFWNTLDGTLLRTAEDYGVSVAFSPNGSLLTLNFGDGIKIYDVADMRLLQTVETQPINASAYTPYMVFFLNGRGFVMVTESGSIRVFGVPSDNSLEPNNIPTMLFASTPQSESTLPPVSTQSASLPTPAMLTAASTQIVCSNFISQLQPNVKAIVLTDALNIRENPGTAQTVVGIAYMGEEIQIFNEPPVCSEGYLWWKVQAVKSGASGWVVEGIEGERWLSP